MKIKTGIKAGDGLGSYIANLTKLTGLDRIAHQYEKITGKSCGCEARRVALDKMFPFNRPS